MLPRVLLLSPKPPPIGGIAIWTRMLLASSLPTRFEVRVVDTAPPEKGSVSGESQFRMRRAFHSLGLLWRFVATFVLFRPQIVHVNTSYGWAFLRDGAIIWLARLGGARTLLHIHGGDFPRFWESCPRAMRKLVDATLARVDRIVTITRETERYVTARVDPERVAYLPSFVRTDLFAPSGSRREACPPRDDERVEVLFVGWILEAKGVRELLAAARALPQARFTLAGPVEPRFVAEIEGEIAQLGSRVRLLGPQEHDRILELYAASDIFVLPTHREGFPMSVLEAMAAQLPVVSTPVGAIPDVIEEGASGFLVPVRDAKALVARLEALIGDPEMRRAVGRRARQHAEERFDLEKVTGDLESTYRALLA